MNQAVRTFLTAVVATTILLPATLQAKVAIDLTVNEPAGIARTGESISAGVPLPKGACTDVSKLALTANGRVIPAQFKVLNRYWKKDGPKDAMLFSGDGSIKWVLVDFQATVPAKGKVAYKLVDSGAKAPATRLMVKDAADSIAVKTGPLQFTVSKTNFRLFEAAWIDLNNDGKFSGNEQVIAADNTDGFAITGMDGKTYTSGQNAITPTKVSIEESGPVRVVIVAEGVMSAGNNAAGYDIEGPAGKDTKTHVSGRDGEKVGFTIRIHAYAGSSFVRVFHTLRCQGNRTATINDMSVTLWPYSVSSAQQPGNFFVKSGDLISSLKLDKGANYTFGGDLGATEYTQKPGGRAGQPHAGTLGEGKEAVLYQDSSAGWTWQVHENKIYDPGLTANVAFMKSKGHNKAYFEYESGYFDILTRREGCSFMGYKIFENGKEVLQGNRAVGWLDVSDKRKGVAVGSRWFWQQYPKSLSVNDTGKLAVGLWPKQWRQGHLFEGSIHFTHELFYYFHGANAKVADVAGTARARLLATPSSEHFIKTGAFGKVVTAAPGKNETFEGYAKTAAHEGYDKDLNYSWDSSMSVEHEKYDEYRWMNFGDGSKRGGIWGWGQFMEYDFNYCAFLHYVRTLDRALFDVGEQNARYLMGIPAHGGGYGHQYPEASHSWEMGLLYYYFLTGSLEAREAMEHMAVYRVNATNSGGHNNKPCCWNYNGRNAAWQLWAITAHYDLTGDQKWLDMADKGFQIIKSRTDGAGKFGGGGPMDFQMGCYLDAQGWYYTMTGNPAAKDALLKGIGFFEANPGQKGNAPWMVNAYAYAYLVTGKKEFLATAESMYKKNFPAKSGNLDSRPKFRQGTGSIKGWTRLARSSQAYLYALENPPKPAE